MNKLKQLISETLQNYKVTDSCKHCNTPPLLVESKQYNMAISEAMRYHIDGQIQLTENIYRPGSFAHQKLLTEARILWSKGIIELQGTDKKLYENTDIGRWVKYEGEFVPLDLPLMEIITEGRDAVCATCGEHGYDDDLDRPCTNCGDNNWSNDYEDLGDEFGQVYEAEYQGKEVALGKPKRGGSKKFYVYVKDGDKVKKVSFGMAGGALRAKLNNPKARKAFSDRMNCPQAKDKTTARYWSCRLPRYARLLGFKTTFTGYW